MDKYKLYNSLQLIWAIAKTDFALRYYGSFLGYIWALFKPFLLFLVLWIVFSVFMKWNIPNYQVYLLMGIMLWNFFAEATSTGLKSLAAKAGIIKKIYFPRILIVISGTLTALFGLFLNLIILFIFGLFFGVKFSFVSLALLFYIIIFYILVLGLSLLLSALYLKFKDIDQIWEVLLSAMFWFIPIVYAKEMIPVKYQELLSYNPITGIIEFSRLAILEQKLPDFYDLGYVVLVSILIFGLGFYVFKHLSPLAAEEL